MRKRKLAFSSLGFENSKSLNHMRKSIRRIHLLGAVVIGFFLVGQSHAQSDPTGKKAITQTFAITNATIYTDPDASGEKSTLLIKNGILTGIGPNLVIPAEAYRIEADSLFVYPGFIAAASRIGVSKPEEPEKPADFISSNPPDELAGITPWRSVVDHYDGNSSAINDLRNNGFTLVHALPEGGMISGKGSLMLLGSPTSSNLFREEVSLAASLKGASRMYPATAVGAMAKFRDVYKNSAIAISHQSIFTSSPGVQRPSKNPTYEAMKDVVTGKIPVFFEVKDNLEIRRAISLQEELGFQLVLFGLEEYDDVIDLLQSSQAGVVLKLQIPEDKSIKNQKEDVSESIQKHYDRVKASYDQVIAQAGKLAAAGVPFAFSLVDTKPSDLSKALHKLIESGLEKKDALAALTTHPAKLMGIQQFTGTLEKGKFANLILSTGPLFEKESQIHQVMVDGQLFDIEKKEKPSKTDPEAASIAIGSWNYTAETPAGSSSGILTIEKQGASLIGEISYDDPANTGRKVTSSISDISVSGKTLNLIFEVNAQGTVIPVKVSGDISGNKLEGQMNLSEFGSFPINATRDPNE